MTAALRFAITFLVYRRNLGFQSTIPMNAKFIDSSKWSLKCVFLHNENLFGAVPIGNSVCLREEHGDVKRVVELLQYDKHN